MLESVIVGNYMINFTWRIIMIKIKYTSNINRIIKLIFILKEYIICVLDVI